MLIRIICTVLWSFILPHYPIGFIDKKYWIIIKINSEKARGRQTPSGTDLFIFSHALRIPWGSCWSAVSDSVDLGWGLGVCISNKFSVWSQWCRSGGHRWSHNVVGQWIVFLRLLAATHNKKYIELNNPMFILCVYGVCVCVKKRNREWEICCHTHTHTHTEFF